MEEDKGSPPGHLPVASQTEEKIVLKEEKNVDNGKNEDVEGVPPTWPSIPPILQPVRTAGDVGMLDKQEDDEDRPPLGCQFCQPHDLQKLLLLQSCFKGCSLVYVGIFTSRPCDLKAARCQMVCGFCRLLFGDPQGVKYVQCLGCQTVNLVLEV